jgi:peroxiredoxin Q/BCP
VILGISADSEKTLAKFRRKYKFTFSFISDPTHTTIEAYGVWRTKKFMGRSYKGIVRSTALINGDGKIGKFWDSVSAKGHAAEVLAELNSHG